MHQGDGDWRHLAQMPQQGKRRAGIGKGVMRLVLAKWDVVSAADLAEPEGATARGAGADA